MTNPQVKIEAKKLARAEPDEAQVAGFLARHPEFFDRHPAVLAELRLPHQRADGATVSLVARQVELLRERARESERRLASLVDNGRANDALGDKIHRLACHLVRARDAAARLTIIEKSLREDFGAREFVLVLTHRTPSLAALEARCLRIVDADDPALRSFATLCGSGRPRCGRVRDSQRDFLFPAADIAVGSVALVPLGAEASAGILAIASPEVDHFNPTMSTEFLARIGELVATALDGPPGSGG